MSNLSSGVSSDRRRHRPISSEGWPTHAGTCTEHTTPPPVHLCVPLLCPQPYRLSQSLVFDSLTVIPYSQQNFFTRDNLRIILSLEGDNKTISSIRITMWSHFKKPSLIQLSFISLIRSFTCTIMNNRQDVGEPWRTPTVVTNLLVLMMLSITLYIMAQMIPSITMPHPRRIRILTGICLGTKSYALLKSINVTNNFFLLLATSLNRRKVTIYSIHPRPLCAPGCSRYGLNQCSSLAHNTTPYWTASRYRSLRWCLCSY